MAKNNKMPAIRFSGYTDVWEQRKFGDLFEYERPDAYIVKSDNYNNDFNMPVLTANKAFILGYTNEENSYNKPSIIFDDFTLDRKYVDFPYMLKSSAIKILTSKNQHNLRFLFERLNSTRFEVLGHARHYISVVQNTTTLCPSVDEEVCISNLLTKFDELITLHQRKLEKLKLTKKALLQKLFPKNGSKFPELRFQGFTDAWEQRKLGDLLILLKDGSHGTHKNTDEGVYLLSAKNIKNGQINIMPDDRIISWEDYDVIHKNYELQFGDILLTIVGSIGETAIYNLKTKVTFQRSVAFLRPSSDLNNGFLYTLINTDSFQNQLQTKQVVSAQPGIYLGDLASIDIIYPKNLSEQEKIYSIFKEIENSITLHQRKLDMLKNVKKGLLQKMFV